MTSRRGIYIVSCIHCEAPYYTNNHKITRLCVERTTTHGSRFTHCLTASIKQVHALLNELKGVPLLVKRLMERDVLQL